MRRLLEALAHLIVTVAGLPARWRGRGEAKRKKREALEQAVCIAVLLREMSAWHEAGHPKEEKRAESVN